MSHEQSRTKVVGRLDPETDRIPATGRAVAGVVPRCCRQLVARSGTSTRGIVMSILPRTEPFHREIPMVPICCRSAVVWVGRIPLGRSLPLAARVDPLPVEMEKGHAR